MLLEGVDIRMFMGQTDGSRRLTEGCDVSSPSVPMDVGAREWVEEGSEHFLHCVEK
jgi:hypothetical protein